MTDDTGAAPPPPEPKVAPHTLALRERPQQVREIDRKRLIGGAAVGLVLIAGLVLVALRPPSLRNTSATELYNVANKPVTDRLSTLPTGYEGVARKAPGVVVLQEPSADPIAEAERREKERLAQAQRQAREAPVLFKLTPTPASRAAAPSAPAPDHNHDASSRPRAGAAETLTAISAADRTRAGATADGETPGTGATEAARKLGVLNAAPEKEIYNPHRLQTPASPYQLMAGTIIAASLVTGLNSDLPGFLIAQVTENVFDSIAGRYLLIPQGTRLIGKYDHAVAFGQDRALVIWQRLILPDGSSIVIDNLPATDTSGYAGLTDTIDLHTWQLLKGIALATVLGVGTSVAFGAGSGDSDLVRALRESTGQTTNRAGQRLVERQLNVQPTLTVRPGWPLRVIVHKDIVFLRPYRLPASK
jgi:type IV secretion system protein TrbI